jgi:hypothetical protein
MGDFTIEHAPEEGALAATGPTRMNITMTPRSNQDGGTYIWRHRHIRSGTDRQTIPVREPAPADAMVGFPAIIAAKSIDIGPRGVGFARYAGDVGDEALTVILGILYAEDAVTIDGRGGHRGEPFTFDEDQGLSENDVFDEVFLRIDLNDDGDRFDLVKTGDIVSRPVIRVSRDRFNIDINNDGVFSFVVLGESYPEFFAERGYALPALVYHEGSVFGRAIRIRGQCAVFFDSAINASGIPFGFDVAPSPEARQGLLSWREITRDE